jgi:hypothetical protein
LANSRTAAPTAAGRNPLSNASLTSAIAGGVFRIMGDKSPKANQKQKAQQKAKASGATQKKNAAAATKAAPKKK